MAAYALCTLASTTSRPHDDTHRAARDATCCTKHQQYRHGPKHHPAHVQVCYEVMLKNKTVTGLGPFAIIFWQFAVRSHTHLLSA